MTKDDRNSKNKSEVYRFGDHVLDADRRELRAAGETWSRRNRKSSICCFTSSATAVALIDKDEIQDAIWPRSIVTETALTRAVMKARRAVGDDAESARPIIRTVHGHGYRFVAELVEEPVEQPKRRPAEADTAADPALRARGSKLLPIAIAVRSDLRRGECGWWYLAPSGIQRSRCGSRFCRSRMPQVTRNSIGPAPD